MSTIFRFARATVATLFLASSVLASATALADIRDPLTPENSAVLLVDLQPQYAFSVHSIDADKLINNATGLSKAARVFGVPTIFTTINAKNFAGSMFTQVTNARPDVMSIDRTSINALADERVQSAVARTQRKKILVGGLWTDSCVTLPVLSLLKQGHEVYVLTDIAGDVDEASHQMAIQRMVQAGAVPVTWLAVMLEWQGDWSKSATTGQVGEIALQHGGAWGLGIAYAREMKVGSK
jgi:nicotinamidase-related amidase